VKLTVTTAFTDEFTAVLSDAAFFASPVKVGEGVTLSWDKQDSIVLGRVEK
jgi:putative spermidine/putrescine transport system ATP-binding protein